MQTANPLSQLKRLAFPLAFFSLISNLAVLISPIYMMQVLDRVVPSQNLATLGLLLLVALGAVVLQGAVEACRDSTFSRVRRWVETVGATLALRLAGADRQAAVDEMARVAGFFGGSLAITALNLPWIPLFLIALAMIHPAFLLLVGSVVGLSWAAGVATRLLSSDETTRADSLGLREQRALSAAADPHLTAGIRAIGENLSQRYVDLRTQRHEAEARVSDIFALHSSGETVLRSGAQILALSLGAYLVVRGSLTSGGMIGASIICAKTIGTIEASIGSFQHLRSAFGAYRDLGRRFVGSGPVPTEIDAFSGKLACANLIFPRGNGAPPRLDRIGLSIEPGECLAIVGDSGSGKTTLLHALCGIEPAPIGSVFLDQSDVRTLGPKTTANQIGYLPQQARLVHGTLAENISCFDPHPQDNRIIEAARTAGVHGLISALPQAYESDIGKDPYLLSAGQKQRVALARAIYAQPQYLFLDEPNALLDAAGERQLCDTLAVLKERGTTIVMVLHRSGIMGLADKLVLLDQGRMADFGSRAEVLGRMNDGKQRLKIPLNAASVQDLNDWIVAQFNRHTDREFCLKAALVGTELFNAACLNGPDDIARQAVLTFRFCDDTTCELILREERQTEAASKMPKIRSLVKHPEVSMIDLPTDEIALAVLAQMSDKLSVENLDDASLFQAFLISDRAKQARAAERPKLVTH